MKNNMKHITITSSEGTKVDFLAHTKSSASGGLGTLPELRIGRFGLHE